MKRIIQIALLLYCVLSMEMGQPAYAAQFNVTVPLNLSNISAEYNAVVVKGFILCGTPFLNTTETRGGMGGDPWALQVGQEAFGQQIVGISQQIHPINTSTGEFHSSIILSLNVALGYYPNNVGSYAYTFKLQGPNGAEFLTGGNTAGPDGNSLSVPHYIGDFNNPAQVGQQCDDENFSH